MNWDFYLWKVCQVFCDDGYTFTEATQNIFTCKSGSWSPALDLPECINKALLGKFIQIFTEQDRFIFYDPYNRLKFDLIDKKNILFCRK